MLPEPGEVISNDEPAHQSAVDSKYLAVVANVRFIPDSKERSVRTGQCARLFDQRMTASEISPPTLRNIRQTP